MPKKGVSKENLSASINKELFKEFNEYCDENCINKSQVVETLLRKYLEEKKAKK